MATCGFSPGDKPSSLLDLIHIVSQIFILQNQRTGRTTGNRTESKEILQYLIYIVCHCQFGCRCFASIGVHPAKINPLLLGWIGIISLIFTLLNFIIRPEEKGSW